MQSATGGCFAGPVAIRSEPGPAPARAAPVEDRLPSHSVSTASPAASPAGGLLDRVERAAWRVPLPTRRLFQTLALVAAAALAVSGLAAGWVAARNAATIDDAREQGLDLATAVTEYRTRLASADATAAATLIAGGLESTESRAQYDADLLEASAALTSAGLVARPEDRDDIEAMANGLVQYAGLVETSRANSRLGYPVGSAYLNQARDLVNDDLVPRADRLRRVGEQRMARAANSVGGPLSGLAVVLLLGAVAILVACALVVSGRTRRMVAHPAMAVALIAIVAALVVVTNGIVSQGRELREAATTDIDAYVDANAAASALSNLRVTEISAVAARGSGAALYEQFDTDAADLLTQLSEAGNRQGVNDLYRAVESYIETVGQVEVLDTEQGDNQGAAQLALSTDEGGSARAYALASTGFVPSEDGGSDDRSPVVGTAAGNVAVETADLEDRFDAAADADIHPIVPVALGVVAAVLAAAGVLARGRRYR